MFKKATSLFLALCLTLSFVTPAFAWSPETAPIIFDFQNEVVGGDLGGNQTITQQKDRSFDVTTSKGELVSITLHPTETRTLSKSGEPPFEGITWFKLNAVFADGLLSVSMDDIEITLPADATPVPPSPPSIPPVMQSLNNGTGPDLNATTSTPSGATFAYRWYMREDDSRDTTTSMVLGTNPSIKAFVNYPGTFYYFCEVTNTSSITHETVKTENYVVTVNNNPSVHVLTVSTDSGNLRYARAAGNEVSITAPDREGYTFTGWVSDNGGTFEDASSHTTTFTVPNGDVTVTATYSTITNAATPQFKKNMPEGLGGVILGETHTYEIEMKSIVEGLSYQWQSAKDEINFTNIEGAESLPSITLTVTSKDRIYYRCIVTNTDNSATGNKTASVTSRVHSLRGILPEPAVTITTPPETVFVGQTVPDLVATVNGTPPYTYTYLWEMQKDLGEYTPRGTDLYQDINGLAEGAYIFRLTVTTVHGEYTSAKGHIRHMNVIPLDRPSPPTFTQQPDPVTYLSGMTKIPLVVEATPGNGMGTVAYRWEVDGVPVVGATSSSFTVNHHEPGIYGVQCFATTINPNAETTFSEEASSNVFTLTISPRAPMSGAHIDVGRATMQGTRPEDIILVTENPNYGVITCQWQVRDAENNWHDYGEPGTTLIQDFLTVGTHYYRCKATNAYAGLETTVYLGYTYLDVIALPPSDTPVLSYPDHFTIFNSKVGDSPIMVSAHASGSDITYQWYDCDEHGETINGVGTGQFFALSSANPGTYYYRAVVTNTQANSSPTSITTDLITHIVAETPAQAETPVLLFPHDFTPYIKEQGDAPFSISAEALGTSVTYQWYECYSDGSIKNALGSNPTIWLGNTTVGTRYYKAELTNVEPDKISTSITTPLITHTVTAPTYFLTTYGIRIGGTNHLNSALNEDVEVTLAAGVRDGFVFSGWTSSASGSFYDAKSAVTAFKMPGNDVVVTANWKAIRTLTVYLNGDDDNPPAFPYAEGDVVNIHAVARPHHSFAGWQADPGVIIADRSNPNTTVTIGSEDIEVTATWALNNSLTVDLAGGNGSAYSSVYPVGYVVSINAGSRSGYTFAGWTSSNDGTFANAANASTTFTMPDNATTITATWTAVPSRGGGGGGSTSTAPTNTTGTITASTTDGTKTSSNDVKVETKSGRTEITVAKDFMQRTVDKALDESVKESKDATVTLSVTAPSTSNRVAVGIPVPSIDALARSSTNASLTVDTPEGSITFNRDALETTAANAEGATVILELARVEKKDLTDSQKDMVGDRPVVDLTLTSNGRQISKLHGNASVTIPYTPYDGEDTSKLVVWYLEDNGNLTPMECTYADGKVTFVTTHFSVYVVASNKFNDVKISDWFYSSVAKAQEKGLMNGVSSEKFAPQQTTTRAMVTTMLYRLEGNPKSTTSAKYSDIVSDQYYAQAVAWASDTGVVKGISEDIFAPSTNVTREQLVTMLYRYAGSPVISMEYDPDKFSDADEISDYARTAIAWGVKVGIIKGNANGTLNAKGYATRAEVATIFSNFK